MLFFDTRKLIRRCAVTLTVCAGSALHAQDSVSHHAAWHHHDLQSDGVFGVSNDRAYRELLRGKIARPVIVGLIDSGTDTAHVDLHSVLWRDPVRGTFGWNFIAAETGREDVVQLVAGAHPELAGQLTEKRAAMRALVDELTEAQTHTDRIARAIDAPAPTPQALTTYVTTHPADSAWIRRILARLPRYPNWRSYQAAEILTPRDHAAYHVMHGLNPENMERDTASGNADVTPDQLGLVKDPNFTAYHGTHVAGIIGAVRGNGEGVDGIADHVQLMTLKANGTIRELRDRSLADAIRFAVDHGATVINMSLGKPYTYAKTAVDSAVRYAMAHDVVLVHAAGNTGEDLDRSTHYPNPVYADGQGAADAWIEVGASDSLNGPTLPARFSNYGQRDVDVFAPGVDIPSTIPENHYIAWSGTSMAAPVVTGIVALIREYYPTLTAVQVKHVVTESVIRSASLATKCRSGGVVNAYNALRLAAWYTDSTHEPRPTFASADSIMARRFAAGTSVPSWNELEAALDSATRSADPAIRDVVAVRIARYGQSPLAVLLSSLKAELRLVPLFGSDDPRRYAHVRQAASLVDKLPPNVRASGDGKEAWCALKSFEAERAMREGNPAASLRQVDACLAVHEAAIASQKTMTDFQLISSQDFGAMLARVPVLFAQRERTRYAMVGHGTLDTLRTLQWIVPPSNPLPRQWRARVTIVEFATPQCAACGRVHGALRQLLERSRARDVDALVVTYLADTTHRDSAIAVMRKAMAIELGARVPVALTTVSASDNQFLLPIPSLFRRYGANGSPTLFLVDRQGIVRDVLEGTDPDLGARLTRGIARIRRML